jgi:molecular chaperone DnaK
MAENDPDRINSTTDRLTTASHKLAEAMYKASSQPGAGAAPGGDGGGSAPGGEGGKDDGGKGKDNVVDAEFVDVDDKQK